MILGVSGAALRRGLLAMLFLPGPIVLLFILVAALSALLRVELDERSALPFLLLASLLGGAAWGHSLRRPAKHVGSRLAWVGGLSFGAATTLAVYVLGRLEPILVEQARLAIPMHITFALLFVAAVALVAAISGLALGGALGDGRLALRLAGSGGLAAGLAFLVADVVQDLLGRRVGGPNAAATATMLTVLLVGCLVAALAAGAVIAELLARHRASTAA